MRTQNIKWNVDGFKYITQKFKKNKKFKIFYFKTYILKKFKRKQYDAKLNY